MKSSETSRPGSDSQPPEPAPAPSPPPKVPALRPSAPPSKRGGKRRRWLWAASGIAAAVIAAVLYLQPWAPSPIGVAIEEASPAPVTRVLAVNGRIAALHSVDLRPLVGGTLTEVPVAEGDRVADGQVLARIDSAAQEAAVRQAVAALDAALVAQDQAEATYARSLALGANISSAALEADRRAAQSAMQEVARMTALLEQAQVQLSRHTLRAPIAGSIVALDAETGQNVDAATVLMTLADLDELVVETDVDEGYASQISVGQPAILRLAGETENRAGQVSTVAGRVDAATGGLAVKIGFDAPVRAPIGLTVTANIVVDRRDSVLTVPRTALVTEAGATAVFLARDGAAVRQPVTVIDWPAARLIVTEGLAASDPVIRDSAGLSNGQPIRLETP